MRFTFPAAMALFVSCITAYATPIAYNIRAYKNTDPTQSITLIGTTTLDLFVSSPSVLNINLSFSNGAMQNGVGALGQDYGHTVYVGAANDRFSFTDDLHNYTLAGGTFNLQDASGDYVGSVYNGTPQAAAVTVTPEPSSLALLATGVLGIGSMVRRRFV